MFLVREVPDARGQDFALKRVLLGDGEDEDEDEAVSSRFGNSAVEREIAVMRATDHPHALPLLRAEIESPKSKTETSATSRARRRAHMVFPAFPEGTVLDRCAANPPGAAFTKTQLLRVTKQIATALAYLHEHPRFGPLAHRDVKPGNVLLETSMEHDGGLKAVLMDFGSCRPARVSVRDRAGASVQERASRGARRRSARPSSSAFRMRPRRARRRVVARVPAVRGRQRRAVAVRARWNQRGSPRAGVLSGKVAWPEEARDDDGDAALRDVVAFRYGKTGGNDRARRGGANRGAAERTGRDVDGVVDRPGDVDRRRRRRRRLRELKRRARVVPSY